MKQLLIIFMLLSPLLLIGQHRYLKNVTVKDSIFITKLATSATTVLSPTSTGGTKSLATADIGEIATQRSSGQVVVSAGGIQNIAAGGTFERLDEGDIAYTARHLHDFTHSDGRLTYTGAATKHFIIMVHLSVECNETNALIQLQLYKDGALIPLSNDQNDYTAVTTDKGLTIIWLEEFANDEYVELWITSDQSDDNLTLHNGSMVITQE